MIREVLSLNATLGFAVAGDVVTLTHAGIKGSGHEESGVTILQADGREHPLPRAPGRKLRAPTWAPFLLAAASGDYRALRSAPPFATRSSRAS